MKKALVVGVVLLVAGAYLFGLVPQRQRRLALEAEVTALKARAETAEERARLGTLFARLHGLADLAAERNYGQAEKLSSTFFDDVRAEAGRTREPEAGKALTGVLAARDAVTAGLTKADPGVVEVLRKAAGLLQAVLEKPASGPVSTRRPTPAPADPLHVRTTLPS
jgi:hypothetical protein